MLKVKPEKNSSAKITFQETSPSGSILRSKIIEVKADTIKEAYLYLEKLNKMNLNLPKVE